MSDAIPQSYRALVQNILATHNSVKLVGWIDGWMDGWMDVKAVYKIAVKNQK